MKNNVNFIRFSGWWLYLSFCTYQQFFAGHQSFLPSSSPTPRHSTWIVFLVVLQIKNILLELS